MKYIKISSNIKNAKRMRFVKERLEELLGEGKISTTLCNYEIVFEFKAAANRTEGILQMIEKLDFIVRISMI